MAQRRLLCEAAAGVEGPRLGIRLRAYKDQRRQGVRLLTVLDEYARECMEHSPSDRCGGYGSDGSQTLTLAAGP